MTTQSVGSPSAPRVALPNQVERAPEPDCCLAELCRCIYDFVMYFFSCCLTRREEPRPSPTAQPIPDIQPSLSNIEPLRPVVAPPQAPRVNLPEGTFAYVFEGQIDQLYRELGEYFHDRGVVYTNGNEGHYAMDKMSWIRNRWSYANSSDLQVGCTIEYGRSRTIVRAIVADAPGVEEFMKQFHGVAKEGNYYKIYIQSATLSFPLVGQMNEGSVIGPRQPPSEFALPQGTQAILPSYAYVYDPAKTIDAQIPEVLERSDHKNDAKARLVVESMAQAREFLNRIGLSEQPVGLVVDTFEEAHIIVPALPQVAAEMSPRERYDKLWIAKDDNKQVSCFIRETIKL